MRVPRVQTPGNFQHPVFVGGYFPLQDKPGIRVDPLPVVIKTFTGFR
ncbi:MAG: hypothetical protein U5L74_01005 [Ideonella sp.]|nr:hypothetical protein [Ideonella sp.]